VGTALLRMPTDRSGFDRRVVGGVEPEQLVAGPHQTSDASKRSSPPAANNWRAKSSQHWMCDDVPKETITPMTLYVPDTELVQLADACRPAFVTSCGQVNDPTADTIPVNVAR
jgi:hypothetical protein